MGISADPWRSACWTCSKSIQLDLGFFKRRLPCSSWGLVHNPVFRSRSRALSEESETASQKIKELSTKHRAPHH